MAGNVPKSNEDVFVVQSYDNIILVDPNKVINPNGQVSERGINQEDFVMYANLEAQLLPRTKLIQGVSQDDGIEAIQNQTLASINFMKPGGKTFLDNTYTDQITGFNTLTSQGINQPNIENLQKTNKSKDFFLSQNTLNKQDTGLLGIENISIKNTRSFTPMVDITLIDTQGRALFEKGEQSEYAFFFNLPYPTFYLTIKGYYGKAIKYQLILTKFAAAFEAATGNYRINLQFYSYKYTVLAETQLGALFATPFMYTSEFKFTTPQSPAVAAAQVSVGDDKKTVINNKTTRGRQYIANVYKKYKALGLLAPDFPEITFPEFRAQIQALQKNLEETFGQSDFTPLTNADDYFEILQSFRASITDRASSSSWFNKFIDFDKVFILQETNNRPLTEVWILNQKTRSNSQLIENALSELEKIVTRYKRDLQNNPTFGINGNFEVDKLRYTSQIKTIEQINANKSNDRACVEPNSFVNVISSENIDWIATFKKRYNREPIGDYEWITLKNTESQLFGTILDETLKGQTFPSYTFVFSDNVGQFEEIIDKTFEELGKQKSIIINKLSTFLNKKIEGPNGLGFRPTMRNVMGIIFASVEAFYRLLNQVHREAWLQRSNPTKRLACYGQGDEKRNPDNKENVNDYVYPWPLYLTKQVEKDGKQNFVVMYPGEQSELAKTKASDYQIWPEVQFVEEYIRGLAKSNQSNAEQSGTFSDNDIGRIINRISVNAVDFPTSNAILSDLQDVKFLYEIYERVLLQTFWDRLSRPNAEKIGVIDNLSEMEMINVRNALNSFSNPIITKLLKNTAFNSTNYLQVLRNISNEGVGISWQQFIRGIFTSDYLRIKTQKDFSILPVSTINSGAQNSSKDTSILKNVGEFVKNTSSSETDLLDLYPFVYNTWSQQNLSNVVSNSSFYKTTKSLYLNSVTNYITNFENIANANTNSNRPFVNNSYLYFTEPRIIITNNQQQIGSNAFLDFNTFYTEKRITSKYLITEGSLSYNGNTGNLTANQTVSLLNTPYFTNAFVEGVQNDRNDVPYPYLKAAYLFLNSLPLSTLREPLKDINPTDNTLNTSKDYLFATLTKFGAIHRLPYAWILKYGSIWHRYKKFVETGEDILDSVWKNVNVGELYYPPTSALTHQYVTKDINKNNITLYGEIDLLSPGSVESIYKKYVGFYPSLINDVLFFYTGLDYLTGYTNNDIDDLVSEGLNIGATDASMREPMGFDTNFANRYASLDFQAWFTTFDISGSTKFNINARNKTIILPSFGTNYNQVQYECFNFGTRLIMNQSIFGNSAVNDGSIRFFWGGSNFGYFDNSSITKPNYNEYFNFLQPNRNNNDSFILSDMYSNIEEIFGVFKTEILDEFEKEFLNFSRSKREVTSQELLNDDFANRTFQQVFANCMLVDQVIKTNVTQSNYVNTCVNKQGKSMTEAIQNFLNYNIAFRYGNPSNFDRKLFGSVTTDNRYRVFDGYVFSPYIIGTLPGDGSGITLLQSETNYTQAWTTLKTYVGFASVDGMRYTNNGSYITDFFISMNIGFTPENIQIVAPLVKIFATQKLLNDGNYDQGNFVVDINDYFIDKNDFLNLTLNSLFNKLQKQLPQVEETTTRPLLSAIDGVQPKIELYQAFKSFNDKWIAGSNFDEKTIFEEVLFLDRANRDVGDVLIDVIKLNETFKSYASLDVRVIDFVSKILVDNKFFMMPMPAYVNWWGDGEVSNGIEPKSQSVEDIANNLFGIYKNVDTRYSKPAFLCYYVGNPSEHLDLRENTNYGWRTDSFDFGIESQNPLSTSNVNQTNWANTNRVVGFNVDFGTRNQSIFSSINVEQNLGAATTEANKLITEAVSQAGGTRSSLGSVSLYNIYKSRSYNVRIEAMGCALIQPTMYFNLKHVPMFRGSYQIQSVEHRIEAGSFRTYFEGVRIPIYSMAKLEEQLISVNNNLLSELVQQIRRGKQTSLISTTATTNNITIGTSIQTDIRYVSAQPIFCDSAIRSSEAPYNTWDGVEGFTTGITYANFSAILKQKTTDPKVRAMVFYTAYLNGHDDNQFNTFNYDLGGTPLGGFAIPEINYGGLNSYMLNVYTCKESPNGARVPYATFSSFEKSIEFIKNLYFTTNTNNLLVPNNNIEYNGVWQTESDFTTNMFTLWSYYWPRKRFQTPEDFKKWKESNSNSVTKFTTFGKEVYQKLKEFKLI